MSNGLNLLPPRKDVAETVIIFCVCLSVPEDFMCVKKSGKHVYQKSSFFLCHPYRSWEFHDSIHIINIPGVTVPKCRRFWRAHSHYHPYGSNHLRIWKLEAKYSAFRRWKRTSQSSSENYDWMPRDMSIRMILIIKFTVPVPLSSSSTELFKRKSSCLVFLGILKLPNNPNKRNKPWPLIHLDFYSKITLGVFCRRNPPKKKKPSCHRSPKLPLLWSSLRYVHGSTSQCFSKLHLNRVKTWRVIPGLLSGWHSLKLTVRPRK